MGSRDDGRKSEKTMKMEGMKNKREIKQRGDHLKRRVSSEKCLMEMCPKIIWILLHLLQKSSLANALFICSRCLDYSVV